MSQVDLFDHFTAQPVTCTWVLDNFKNYRTDRNYNSQVIYLSYGPSLWLYLRPNEDVPISCDYHTHTCGRFVVIHLVPCPYSTPYTKNIPTVYYRISLINEKGQKWNTQEGRAKIGPKSMGFNGQYIINRDYLFDKANGLLPDGKLTVYCEVFELDNAQGLNKNNLVSMSRDNQSLLDSGKLSDVVVAVGEREFKAHKLILSSRSVVFEKMFEHDLKESKRNRVEITDMSAGAAEDLIKFIYTGKVEHLKQHVYELYAAADKYQIDSLKSYCELYLALSLSISTVPKILQLADLYSLEDLKSKCTNYISLHSTEFKFYDWKELTTSRPELMFEVFQILGNKLK